MGDINYMTFGERELFNVARTARIARVIGLNTVRIRKEIIYALEGRFGSGGGGSGAGAGFGLGGFGLGGFGVGGPSDYSDVTKSPWYSASDPASAEFAGILPLSVQGLDDSAREASTTEYISEGGSTGAARNSTQTLVASVIIVAKTDRGAEYGKRYLDRILRDPNPSGPKGVSQSAVLEYFRYMPVGNDTAPLVHRRDVSLTRAVSITRRKFSRCSSAWMATFTLTADDPYEYGEPEPVLTALKYSNPTAAGPDVQDYGVFYDTDQPGPAFDYTPIYDPLYPALVAPPSIPDFYPDGWAVTEGAQFRRSWARVQGLGDIGLNTVPRIKLRCTGAARMVRVSIFPESSGEDIQVDPLFSAVVSYLPPGVDFYIDGEQRATYTSDGSSPYVRRADSLVYSPDAGPVEWTSFEQGDGLVIAIDNFGTDQSVTASLDLISRSD